MKKILIIGILACVVIGCVLAAGCTSQMNTDSSQVNPLSGSTVEIPTSSDDPIVGSWYYSFDSEDGYTLSCVITLLNNNTGKCIYYENGTEEPTESLLWKKNSDGSYEIDVIDSDSDVIAWENFTLDEEKDRLIPNYDFESDVFLTRMTV